MSQLVLIDGELLRISPRNRNAIEYSTNRGRTWSVRFSGNDSNSGDFVDIIWAEDELLAQTSRGIYYSKDKGRSWLKRS